MKVTDFNLTNQTFANPDLDQIISLSMSLYQQVSFKNVEWDHDKILRYSNLKFFLQFSQHFLKPMSHYCAPNSDIVLILVLKLN